ncbi:MAG: sulfotransferase [Rhizomicrobium sp.]|jgi:tetratricopeptide (TPR) repeat protein
MTNETHSRPDTLPAGQSRNAPCTCGSGKKYKHCCGGLSAQAPNPIAGHGDAQSLPGLPSVQKAAQERFQGGAQLLRSGRPSQAIPLLEEAIRLDPAHFNAHHALAAALLRSGRNAEAGSILLRAVALRPDSAAAWQDLGATYDRQNLHDKAIEAYRKALELSPKLVSVLYRLGEIFAMYSRAEEASAYFERAADIDPETTKSHLYRSDALMLRGDYSSAEQSARKAVALEPSNSLAHGTLASLLFAQGRFEESAQSCEAAIELNPKAIRCWYGLTQCREFSEGDQPTLERMRAVLRRDDLSRVERMTMHFALGKAYDDCGDYAHAMEQFDAANRLRAQDVSFDQAAFAVLVDRKIEQFTKAFIEAKAASGTRDETPIFIVGMYRSGTTLVEQILSSHPQIAAGGELTVWGPTDIELDPATGDFNPERAPAAVERYLAALRKIGPSAKRVTDKLPFNFFRLGQIHALMPKARIIHCRRDPIDTCLSTYSSMFNTRVNFAARKDDLVFCYRQYLRLMDHYRKVLPAEMFLDVQYEDLVGDRDTQTRRLIAFAGLDWDESCLRPEQNKRTINTASAWQARQPVYTTSIQRWRNYEPWLGELRQLMPADASTRT